MLLLKLLLLRKVKPEDEELEQKKKVKARKNENGWKNWENVFFSAATAAGCCADAEAHFSSFSLPFFFPVLLLHVFLVCLLDCSSASSPRTRLTSRWWYFYGEASKAHERMLNLIGKVWPSLQPFPLCVRNFLRELYAVDGNFSFEIELKQQKREWDWRAKSNTRSFFKSRKWRHTNEKLKWKVSTF